MSSRIEDDHGSVVQHRLREIAVALRQCGDRRLLAIGIAAQGALVSQVEAGPRIMQDLGNIERAADVQAKAAHGIGGLRLGAAVERIRSGVQDGVFQLHEHRTGVDGLAAPPVAEAGVLAVVGAAPVVAIAVWAAASTSTAAKSASAAATSSTAEATSTASGTYAAGALAESSVDAASSETTQAERIAARSAHARGKTQGLAAAGPATHERPAITAASAGHALAPGLVIARLGQAAARAAVHQQGILSLGAQAGGQIGGCGIRGGIGQRLLAIVSGFDLGVLETWAARGRGIRATARSTAGPARNWPGRGRLSDARHFKSPVPGGWLVADSDLVFHGRESEHLDLDLPDTRGEFQCVTAGIIGVCHQLGGALAGGKGGAGNPLVGGPYRAGELRRGQ